MRLYFRPRTPTNYRNEGVRPAHKIEYEAHMPVPVFLLFSLVDLITEAGTSFTHGRMEPGTPRGSTAGFLRGIPFKKVYHDSGVGALGTAGRSEILNARHSEVLVNRELPLDFLKWIVCRSAPERQTLLNLLTPTARRRWSPRTVLEKTRPIFCKRGTFMESVTLSTAESTFQFSTQTEAPSWRGPFDMVISWEDGSGWSCEHHVRDFHVTPDPFALVLQDVPEHYTVRVTLDGNLVYLGRFAEPSGPEVLK